MQSIRRRIAHVDAIGASLVESIQGWIGTAISTEAVIDDDRMGWTLHVRLDPPAPLDEWALRFSDGIHNLRSSLDNLAWTLAHHDGHTPSHPKRVAFPMAGTTKIRKETPNLFSERVWKILSSYHQSPESGQPLLPMLAWFSNEDKHRSAHIAAVSHLEIQHTGSVEYRSEAEAEADGPPQVALTAISFTEPAQQVLRQTTRHPIVKVKGTFSYNARVLVQGPPGQDLPIIQALGMCRSAVAAICESAYEAVTFGLAAVDPVVVEFDPWVLPTRLNDPEGPADTQADD